MIVKDLIEFFKRYDLENATVSFDGFPPEFEYIKGGDMHKIMIDEQGEVTRYIWRQDPNHKDWHGWTEMPIEYMEVHNGENTY